MTQMSPDGAVVLSTFVITCIQKTPKSDLASFGYLASDPRGKLQLLAVQSVLLPISAKCSCQLLQQLQRVLQPQLKIASFPCWALVLLI